MAFLFDELDTISKYGAIEDKNYSFVEDNLNPKFELREYQKEAFNRFYFYYEGDKKPSSNIHLCFNMATGSGKTVIMSGAILYLYEKGYRNFLFFVNRGQILEKTKDNFINTKSNKYLFDEKIVFNDNVVKIKSVDNFSESSPDDINICFTTIQGLFSDIHNPKENALTIENFRDEKIVLIADEAHHINASTKIKVKTDAFKFDGSDNIEKPSWENTVETIFKTNKDNILLEFTATLELDNKSVKEKYLDKIIYKYDLKNFVEDKYSKKIELFRSDTTKEVRVLQALIISLYREEIAIKYGLNIKPVVLLKSSKIDESKTNQSEFHSMIESLDEDSILDIKNRTNIEILKTAFAFFEEMKIPIRLLIEKLKIAFKPSKCLCTNSDKELEENQRLLNSLEDTNNAIRAIFTVDKLNEGWDVLNLFDIVRLYEGQSMGGSNKGKIGKKTISEAQLVGRGARYCPFRLNEYEELFKRKYDYDIKNELRILEELFFHSENESRYISEIKKALIEQGLMESEENAPIELDLKLKTKFNTTDFLNTVIFKNDKIVKNYDYVKTLSDFGIAESNFFYEFQSGKGSLFDVFDDEVGRDELNTNNKERNLVDFVGETIISNAILQNDFFTLSNLLKYLKNLKSMREFIHDKAYLKQFNVDIKSESNAIEDLNTKEKLKLTLSFLSTLENEMKSNIINYEGTEFKAHTFKDIFKSKTLLIPKDKDKDIINSSDDWFVFSSFYGTSEEEKLIEFIGKMMENIEDKYKKEKIYLIRNEREFKIFNFKDGRAFEPDFLFLAQDKESSLNYQIFIEPKGKHIESKDGWKEDFLSEIKESIKGGFIEFENQDYKLLGLKFYNKSDEKSFKKEFKSELGID